VLVDIGGTIVAESAPGTPVHALVPQLLANVSRDLLALSHSVRLGAATNTAVMAEVEVRRLLALVDVDRFFEVVVTSHDVGAAKPDPAVLLVAMDRLGIVDPSRVLYVGDRTTDREAALSAGMEFAPITDDGLLAAVRYWATSKLSSR
jgi:FMN phosphatase YigB (HAD superfamily)